MSDFATWADVLLPCTTSYEAWDLRTNPGYQPLRRHLRPPANLEAGGEVKSEWEISNLIVESWRRWRGPGTRPPATSGPSDPDAAHAKDGFHAMDRLVEEFTQGGKLRTDREAVEFALEHVDQFEPSTAESMVERGGFLVLNEKAGKTSPPTPTGLHSFENNLYLHQRFETVSGRLTFTWTTRSQSRREPRSHGRRPSTRAGAPFLW